MGDNNHYYEQDSFSASDGASGDSFGYAVDISGDWAIVGAPFDDNARGTNAGAAYSYVRRNGSWSFKMKIIADDGAGGDNFGHTLALTQYFAIVGAPNEDNASGADAGACYVYYRPADELLYFEKLTASDGAAGNLFGYRTAMSGEYAVFGAIYRGCCCCNPGE